MNIQRIQIIDVAVSALNPSLAQEAILEMVQRKEKAYVCVAPVSTLVDCQRVPGYKEVLNNASLVTPDGAPVAWLCRLKGAKEVQRTYGPDLMRNLCQQASLKHFLYGATEDVLNKLIVKLKEKNPSIAIVGWHAPSFSPQAKVENPEIIDKINTSLPDIVWVALGSPKQDFWMSYNRPLLNAPVLIGVGAAFDFIAEVKPQAPRWMQQCALEWLFRFCCEPKRLWKRYLIGNSLFIFYIFRDFLRKDK